MSYTRPIVGKVTLQISGFPMEKTDALEDFMDEAFKSIAEWEFRYGMETDPYPIVAIVKETGTETVYPGCYTLPNGDPGYPDEYEDDLVVNDCMVEEYFEEFCRQNGLQEVEYLTFYDTENP